ncbi:MAG: AAA family ATPase [Bacteroidales bacterium]|nr:AAA family ATPase [Bacteroidales bacterium]
MIEAIRIQNLRSLKDTGFIDIKPLTILVGVNSSGKSTFLRSFPLFTQSIKKNLRGVISWFDESLVDFGNYSIAKNRFAGSSDTIKFSYKIDYKSLRDTYSYGYFWHGIPFSKKEIKDLEITISLKYSELDNEEYVNSVYIRINKEHFINFSISDRNSNVKFKINDTDIHFQKGFLFKNRFGGQVLPYIDSNQESSEDANLPSIPSSQILRESGILLHFANEVIHIMGGSSVKMDERNVKFIIEIFKAWSLNKEIFLKKIKNLKFYEEIANNWDVNSIEFEKIYNIIFLQKITSLLPIVDDDICRFYTKCSYIAPVRAVADSRVIRDQNLQVADIDPEGKNLREFLKSLSAEQKESYDNFIKKILNIKVEVKTEQTHLSLFITQANEKFNITDVGFGYSQILPIITKLWWWHEYYGNGNSFKSTLLFEQPELHLHPAYQAKIADAFINSIIRKDNNSVGANNKQKSNMNLIVETHSQTIINRIGRRIYEGFLSPQNVNIVIFEKNYNEQTSNVRQTTFDKKGKIIDWPRGFFDPLDETLF